MSLYADTSLLISYYINDSHSVSAQAVLHRATDPLPFTGLHRLEIWIDCQTMNQRVPAARHPAPEPL